jgi:uncharacterized protein (DUF2252 family)
MALPQKKQSHAISRKKVVAEIASLEELLDKGKSLRQRCPRADHAIWSPPAKRIDPVKFIEESNKGRLPELIPIRHGRMLMSPFTFYRGSAGLMASDLSHTPTTGIRVQACGDAHLANFGAFATPERRLIFDTNDLDETLPAPWEWDVKRLAASFLVASRNNKFSRSEGRDAVLACVRSYREHMAEYAEMSALEVWYERIDVERLMPTIRDEAAKKRFKKRIQKAQSHNILEDLFPKMVQTKAGRPIFREDRPLIYHPTRKMKSFIEERASKVLASYGASLPEERRILFNRYHLKDVVLKVVGVGSVGTLCLVALMMAGPEDVLFLQVKQANASVLEPYAGKSLYANHGERVVKGYRIMQSASDIFLGWTQGRDNRHFFVRQLRDMKIKPLVEIFNPNVMSQYAEFCGWALAHSHARSGEPALISGYMGNSDKFDEALADFSVAYADQNEKDYEIFLKAAQAGKFEVQSESV